jgi:hypothetical protein
MTLSLNFKEGGWCKELNTSYAPGLYFAKDEDEYNALASYAGVEIISTDEDTQTNNGSPYATFKMADFNKELTDRGINFDGVKENAEKEALLLKDDAEKALKTKKEEATIAGVEDITDEDTIETLQAKIDAKGAIQ